MNKMLLHEYAYPGGPVYGTGEKNTIANGPNDGVLNCFALDMWNPVFHGSTKQAIENGVRASGALNIAGCGDKGLIETGMGQAGPFDNNKIIMSANESNWGTQLERIKPTAVSVISLLSSMTGAGQVGADLLYTMAVHSGRPVRARTGFIFCGDQGIYFENGSVWQMATPTSKPVSIATPNPNGLKLKSMQLYLDNGECELKDVELIEITTYSLGTGAPVHVKAMRDIPTKQLVWKVFLSTAMEMKLFVGGIVTGKVRLHMSGAQTIEFTIYNDRLALDGKSDTGYYIGSINALAELLP